MSDDRNAVNQNTDDIRTLTEKLEHLEERVSELEWLACKALVKE